MANIFYFVCVEQMKKERFGDTWVNDDVLDELSLKQTHGSAQCKMMDNLEEI